MGRSWAGRDGKEKAFVDEEQHVQMHRGGHMRKTWTGLFGLKTQLRVGEIGRWGWRECISCCRVMLRDTERQETPALFPRNSPTGWGAKTDPGKLAPG